VEHRADVEQFRVGAQAESVSLERTEEENPAGVVEQQRAGGVADQFGGLAGQPVDR
jgi:hypothetical protein